MPAPPPPPTPPPTPPPASPSREALAFETFLRSMRRQGAASPAPTLAEQRAGYSVWGDLATEPPGVTWEPGTIGGRPALWALPAGADRSAVVLYLHGGAYVLGTLDAYRRLTGHIASAAGVAVASVEYRLAPETPFPGAVEDAVAAYRALLAERDAGRVVVSGDSAGGGLALALLLALRANGLPPPAGAALISPWADLSCSVPSWDTNAGTDLMLERTELLEAASAYLAGTEPSDSLASPVHGDYSGVSPLYLQAGGAEVLVDDSFVVAERAAAAGVEVRLDVWPFMQHDFQLLAGNMPEADEAVARMGAWVTGRLRP